MTTQAQLPDEQLDRLETLLDDPALPESMRLDEIQGYLCAALAGPRPMREESWLEVVLGNPAAQASEAGREATELLRRFATALADELARGEAPMLLLYPVDESEDSPSDYQPWCQAYLHGIDSAEDDWFDYLGEGEKNAEDDEIAYIDERIFAAMVLSGEAEVAARDAGEQWPEGDELEQLAEDCQSDLPLAVSDVYRFWLAKRGASTLRRETPKVGRNDPCPCGSGKKYKQCCGKS